VRQLLGRDAGPWSTTPNTTLPLRSASVSAIGVPFAYLIALPIRFANTCSTRSRSATTVIG
jgi:hypothetical protein